MSEVENETAMRAFFAEVWNRGDVAKSPDFLGETFISHNNLGLAMVGPDAYGQAVTAYRAAFPDLTTTLDDVFAAGDRVAVRGTDRGTHRGAFMGRPPSGRTVTTTWIEIFRMEAGKAVEGWIETDLTRLLDQLETAPPPAD